MKPTDVVFLRKNKWYSNERAEKFLLILVDTFSLLVAFYLARLYVGEQTPVDPEASFRILPGRENYPHLLAYTLLSAAIITSFWVKGHYTRRKPYAKELREIINVTLPSALLDTALVFFGKWDLLRDTLLINWFLVPVLLTLTRTALKCVLIRAGGWVRPLVIIGWGENALATARAFDGHTLMGFNLVAFLTPAGDSKVELIHKDRSGALTPCIPLGTQPQQLLRYLGNPQVVLALEHGEQKSMQNIVQELARHSKDMQIAPPLRGLPLYGMQADHFFAHDVLLLSVRNNVARRGPKLVKRCFDIVASICLICIGAPLLLWLAARVLASGRPIFYGHERIGRHGKAFPCYKFRTMMPDSDKILADLLAADPSANAEWQRDFKLKNDPRITPVGHFLRKTSLDELPQIWNVLKGDMSLVGPRPIINAELERYGNQVSYYLEARPGITGLWQVSGRNNVSYDTRVHLDAWYVKNWSFFNDIVILFKTVKVLINGDGAY